jgi:tripartite-type tricarboxylate transporter receptor subunit TctC
MKRRTFLHLAGATATLPVLPRVVRAQTYPTQPVRIVVAFAVGGPNDIIARLFAQWSSERMGYQFIVDDRPGAGNNRD